MTSTIEPRYPFVHVETSEDDADFVSSLLFDLGASGVEERDQTTYAKAPSADRVLLIASFESHSEAHEAISALAQRDPAIRAKLHEVVGDAWRDAWKDFYEPFALTPSIVVRPPWREAEPGPGQHVLALEPGRAFGTGLHATTALVANILDSHKAALAGASVLDAGCGSGILSFVALLFGAQHVMAFDVDPEVISTVRENAERNGLTERLAVFAGTIGGVQNRRFDWVLANIESKILDPIAGELAARVGPGGQLVLSGILTAEEEWMRQRFTSLDRRLDVVDVRHMATGGERAYDKDGWVALHLVAR